MTMEEGRFGGKIELLKLSRFKLQLRALISEVKDLRERERSTAEQLHRSIKKQKQSEEEFGQKLKDLESELASSIELRQKLERKVNYLQNDSILLENKQKELNATVQGLLQSREHFVNAYQDSICDLKRSIETRDRKLKVFSENLSSHILLFDSIEKEALSVKQVVDHVRHLICEKEEIVTGLKRKFDRVLEVENIFIGKMSEMEIQIVKYKDEIKMKDRIIAELKAKLEAEHVNKNQVEMEELQRALSMKEAIIQNLISEKQVLDSEVKSLEATLEKIQHAFRDMSEGEKAFQSLLGSNNKSPMIVDEVVDRMESSTDTPGRCAEHQPDLDDFPKCIGPSADLPVKNDKEFRTEEPACSITQLTCSGLHSVTNAQAMTDNDLKSDYTIVLNQEESESSTTQANIGEHPD